MSAEPKEKAQERDDFFVGYLGRLPAALRAPAALAIVGLLLGFAGGAFAFSIAQEDPGDGGFAQRATIQGVIQAEPYPHLRLAPEEGFPDGRTYLVVRFGKRGIQEAAAKLDGQQVEARGVWIRRGDIQMLQLGAQLKAMGPWPSPPAAPEDLGRWRIAGEICDGKCYFGAMRPGRGLAHKACANLCLVGGAPPVLVTETPVSAGGVETQFLLLADPEGKPLPDGPMRDRVALLMSFEGDLERRGDLLIFKTDLEAAEQL